MSCKGSLSLVICFLTCLVGARHRSSLKASGSLWPVFIVSCTPQRIEPEIIVLFIERFATTDGCSQSDNKKFQACTLGIDRGLKRLKLPCSVASTPSFCYAVPGGGSFRETKAITNNPFAIHSSPYLEREGSSVKRCPVSCRYSSISWEVGLGGTRWDSHLPRGARTYPRD